MHELLIEGYVRQLERDRQEAQRRRATVHESLRAPIHPMPRRLVHASGALLISIGFWLEQQAGGMTPS